MVHKDSSSGFYEILEGVQIKTLVHGERTLMTKFILLENSSLPLHRHPHEQAGYLLSGRMELTIDDKTHLMEPGDSWTINEMVEHGGRALEDSVVIEVFSPVRADYLPENLARRAG